jgi:ADP-ribose pyrophosphatase YjhB (NUDIX family)
MRIIEGERIGKTAKLRVGCSAMVFDESRQKILLTRRTDNGQWCLPGGGVDVGESVSETCEREMVEETGLRVRVTRLIGIYSTPHRIIEYADGNRWQFVSFSFEAEVLDGELQLSDETTEVGYFTLEEIASMDMVPHHRERISDALVGQVATFVK